MTSNGTSWLFPPALNTTFREAFSIKYNQPNESAEDHGVYAILLEAVRNLTFEQRVDSRFKNQGWGGEDAVVQVGDSIYGDVKGDQYRLYGLNCVICKKGRLLGSIEQACSNCKHAPRCNPYSNAVVELTWSRFRPRKCYILHKKIRPRVQPWSRSISFPGSIFHRS